jgi:hypothetical protein
MQAQGGKASFKWNSFEAKILYGFIFVNLVFIAHLFLRSSNCRLTMDMAASGPSIAQLFYDIGRGFNEQDSATVQITSTSVSSFQHLTFVLPEKKLLGLRFDPLTNEGRIIIRKVAIENGNAVVKAFPVSQITPFNQIANRTEREDAVEFSTVAGANDPGLRIVTGKPIRLGGVFASREVLRLGIINAGLVCACLLLLAAKREVLEGCEELLRVIPAIVASLPRFPKAVLQTLILLPLCLWAVANWWHAGQDVVRFYVDLPIWDHLSLVEHYPAYKAGNLSVFWVQHNEHRIVFPETTMALDFLGFQGRLILPTVLSFSLFFGIWLVIVWALAKDRAVATVPRYAAIFLSAILIAWTGCASPLGSPFLVQWTMNQFFAILALAFLAHLSQTERALWLLPLAACGIVSNYSSGNGLLLWPLLLGLAVCLRIHWRYTSVIGVVGAASTSLYFVGYKQLGALNWRLLLNHPLYLTKFISSYVSMPFAVLRVEPEFGVQIGFISLAGLALLFVIAWRSRLLSTETGIVLFGYAIFILGSGLMTAGGRMNPDDPALQSAKAARYLTSPLTYWGMLAAVSIWVPSRLRNVGTLLATLVALGVSLLLFRMSHKPALAAFSKSIADGYASQQWAALAVENGVFDPATDIIVYPDIQFVPRMAALMRAERLSPFSDPEPFWIGRMSNVVFPGSLGPPAMGGIVASRKLSSTVAIAGWTGVTSTISHRLELVLIDENNRIVGLGERLPAGLPECFANLKIAPDRQWTAFVNLAYGSHMVSPYVVSADRKSLIPLPGKLSIEP